MGANGRILKEEALDGTSVGEESAYLVALISISGEGGLL